MGIQVFKPICKIFSWIFILTSLNFCPGINSMSLKMSKRVAVAVVGDSITMSLTVFHLNNESGDSVVCYAPSKDVIRPVCNQNNAQKETPCSVQLDNLQTSKSGEYYCEIMSVKVYWSLMVREKGFKIPENWGIIIVGTLTIVLGISGMVGSMYILKGNVPSKCGSWASKGEAGEGREEEEHSAPTGSIATAPASVYASLESRPRSIYDTLEPPATRRNSSQGRAASSSPQETEEEEKEKTPRGKQNDGVFESVYENF